MPLFSFEGHEPVVSPGAWIAPTATLVGDVRVEEEASVWYGAVIRADFGPIIIRRGANIQDGSVLHGGGDPSCEIGEGATIGHLCVVHGTRVGAEALIGNGATVLDGAVIGSRALVAAGATVPPGMHVPDGMLAAGVPARVVGELTAGAKSWVETNPGVYRELASRHAASVRPVLLGEVMEFGVAIFPTHDAIRPGDVARLAEERGQESLFFPEHTHIPVDHTPYPGGEPLPHRYVHTFDLFVAVTAAVCATSRLRIGSGVCLLIQRDPITTAKEVASVDYLSGGRFEFGVGAGWNREEMANHGTDPRTRMALLHERVAAMKEIWTSDEASYSGSFVRFGPLWSWPKPAQRPHPPVIVGGEGPTVLDRVLAFGDGWMPNYQPSGILPRAAELRSRAERFVSLQVMGVPADPAVFEAYAAAGFDRVVHWLPSAGRGVVERALDGYEAAIAEFTGG